jgi:hypothetical protein
MYSFPEDYYFRIHHVRPRFKGNVENVLIFVATEIAKLGEMPEDDFKISGMRLVSQKRSITGGPRYLPFLVLFNMIATQVIQNPV